MSNLISSLPILAILLFVVAFGLLGIHHFLKAVRGLRTGEVDGLVFGNFGKKFDRKDDPRAFWFNVLVGLLVAALGVFALLWSILWGAMLIAAYQGYPTL